jgi:hypothetical protein
VKRDFIKKTLSVYRQTTKNNLYRLPVLSCPLPSVHHLRQRSLNTVFSSKNPITEAVKC